MAAFTVIDHTEIGTGGAASWSETGIPTDGTYDHLLILASIRGEQVVKYDALSMTVNGVTSSVYSNTAIYANSTTVQTSREALRANLVNAFWSGGGATANSFGNLKIWIPNYASATNFKALIMSSTSSTLETGDTDWILGWTAGCYNQTTAISSITIASGWGADLAEFSTFTLYGVKGA